MENKQTSGLTENKTRRKLDGDLLMGSGLLALAVALGILLYSFHHTDSALRLAENATDSNSASPQVAMPNPEKPKRASLEAIPKTEFESKTSVTGLDSSKQVQQVRPQSCINQSERIATSSYADLLSDLRSGAFEIDAACSGFETAKKVSDAIYRSCHFDRENHKLVDEHACAMNSVIFRAGLIEELTKDRDDFKSMSAAMLTNKFIAQFSASPEGNFSPKIIAVADALAEVRPDLSSATKAAIMVRLGQLATDGAPVPDGLDVAIARAKAASPWDSEIDEIDLYRKMKQGDLRASDEFVTQNPRNPVGYYSRARQKRAAKDNAGMLADLNEAANLDPKNARFAETLAKASASPKDGEEIFKMNINFQFDDL